MNREGVNKVSVCVCVRDTYYMFLSCLKRLLCSLRLCAYGESYFSVPHARARARRHTHGCFHRQATNAKADQTKRGCLCNRCLWLLHNQHVSRELNVPYAQARIHIHTQDSRVTGAKGGFQISSH